jgi:ABC-type transport system involved in multi-copper enzyme maturation permease subunit
MSPTLLLARKEVGELVRSARGLGWLLTASAVLSVFVLLLIGSTELSLLDNAQAVYMMMGIVTALGSLLAVVIGSDAIAGERERGTLEPLLLAPVSPSRILVGKAGGHVAAWAALYALALPYLWAVGSSGQNLGQAIGYVGLFGTPVVMGFAFFATAFSARTGGVRGALVTSLIALALMASPVLLGPSLRQSAAGRAFDAVNPFSAALNSFDSAIIDSQPLSAQGMRLAVALAWPMLAFVLAWRSMRAMGES